MIVYRIEIADKKISSVYFTKKKVKDLGYGLVSVGYNIYYKTEKQAKEMMKEIIKRNKK